ncbi:MAG: Gfo/Idh/MocA family oxidoreductase [Gemmatimonadetes bacterium]|nr:Gfo/Idh/MocA family oxidoreductase [Gemmatimonadota bacterium]MXY82588.1 Gfo/Idh/MocA family oxidoreductase [Gemmatimonadota bacterium]MYB68581.1 Gfo/Idh/MocA family oxidoreductase [Gemmatimonadota bacterium]
MAKKRGKQRPIRVGVVGVGRGRSFMQAAAATGMELVAICDIWEERLIAEGKALNVSTFIDYDDFLGCDMDAVVLANYFHQHAPFAIKALNAGRHVMSETAACHTLGEGVALARAVEKSGKIYMFAENYPYMVFNQEMKRLYQQGRVGEFKYGEGEYVHPDPPEVKLARSCGRDHWRNWIPSTYYCTHSIAPVMYITDTRPVKVNGFVIPFDFADPTQTLHMNRSDTAAVIICRMDNDAVMKSLHGALRGHGNYVRIHGNKGVMENCRHGDKHRLRVWYEPWEKRKSDPVETVYSPNFPVHHGLAARTGHGGGDFFTSYHFAAAIRTGEPPYLDVYRGIDMSIAGIQAWRSALNDSAPMEIPDFRRESVRRKYAKDDWSPDPERKKKSPPSSILGAIEPDAAAKKLASKVWADQGYLGD